VGYRKSELLAHLDEACALAAEALAQIGSGTLVNMVEIVDGKLA
jgi:hypothetical protein